MCPAATQLLKYLGRSSCSIYLGVAWRVLADTEGKENSYTLRFTPLSTLHSSLLSNWVWNDQES